MKQILTASLFLLSGCYNIMFRHDPGDEPTPYFCTRFVACSIVEPFIYPVKGDWAGTYCAIMWVPHLVDLPLEAAADTVLLPHDLLKR